jgi:hypothetical protein
MKFKNISNKSINIKLGSDWTTIQPSMTCNLPEYIGLKEKDLKKVEEKEKVINEIPKENIVLKPELKTEKELKQMTKDEINDYSAKLGLEEVSCSMLKSEMIKMVLKFKKKQGMK